MNCLGQETTSVLLEYPTNKSMKTLQSNKDFLAFLCEYLAFCHKVREGCLGKTPKFWISYMDHVSLILKLMRAVKTNNFDLYAFCISKMANLFFSFGGQNYARYLTYFSVFLANLESSYPGAVEQVKLGVISVARSFVPGNCCALDKTTEKTFMKHSKSKGGAGRMCANICGLKRNPAPYQR